MPSTIGSRSGQRHKPARQQLIQSIGDIAGYEVATVPPQPSSLVTPTVEDPAKGNPVVEIGSGQRILGHGPPAPDVGAGICAGSAESAAATRADDAGSGELGARPVFAAAPPTPRCNPRRVDRAA